MAATPPNARRKRAKTPTTPDAIDIALESPGDDLARAVLSRHARLIDAQLMGERVTTTLKLGVGLLSVVAAIAFGAMVWNASRASGLTIEAFSVPPALAQRGVTGEAVARQLMDRLSDAARLANSTEIQRNVTTYRPGDIAIEIPNTGVSIGQVDQWLRQTLGHERRISGELIALPDGTLKLIARVGSQSVPPATGTEATLDATVLAVVDEIFKITQPASYGVYRSRAGRPDPAWIEQKMRVGSRQERAAAHHGFAVGLASREGDGAAYAVYLQALELHELVPTQGNLSAMDLRSGRSELALWRAKRSAALLKSERGRISKVAYEARKLQNCIRLGRFTGDYQVALRCNLEYEATPRPGAIASTEAAYIASLRANLHETNRAARDLESFTPSRGADEIWLKASTNLVIKIQAKDWPAALAAADATLETAALTLPDKGVLRVVPVAQKAQALAMLGRLDEAQAVIDATPLDCEPCVRVRGLIANQARDYKTADHWFAAAVKMSPSLPFAPLDWGKALLARGDLAGAFEKFAQANKITAGFADPKHYLGETLLRQGKAAAAVKLFRQADQHAPNWGRNHLLWGEALAKTGKAEAARAQWAQAANLDLTAAERAELTRLLGAR